MLKLDKWPIFSLLDQDFLHSLRFASVFGNAGNEAILVTVDDDVYALGSNCNGCLGVGDSQSALEPRKVEALSRKNVKMFAFGSGPHVLSITESGELYSWGHNGYHQLGNGCTSQGLSPSLVTTNLSGKKVIEVVCGSHHSIALTEDGEVYSWGYNNCGQVGSGSTANQSAPRRVTAALTNKKICQIACGQTSSMALTDSGELFAWGYNGNGQLGIGNTTNQPNPCRVVGLAGMIISKVRTASLYEIIGATTGELTVVSLTDQYYDEKIVVCGYSHTLALSDAGIVYSWGANSYGQLGSGNKSNYVTPTKVAEELGRFVEIATIHYGHISAGSTSTGKVYMWGQCRGQSILLPMETNFTQVDDVFACFSSPPSMFRPLTVDEPGKEKTVEQSVKEAFNNSETSDVTFMIEQKSVYVHKAILKIRCQHFHSMFQAGWEEASKDVIEITQFSYPVYKAFLQYLYSDNVDIPPEDAIGLLDLANSYCEDQLKHLCERIIKQGITIENAAMLMAAAIKYEALELEEFCFKFCINHLTAIAQTEAFLKLDEQTLKDFIKKAAVHGAFRN